MFKRLTHKNRVWANYYSVRAFKVPTNVFNYSLPLLPFKVWYVTSVVVSDGVVVSTPD